ncbi:MAG: DUF2794 domain-containing protein [Pseudomonadota bacterium]|nr:DUF2794 domain-containing protein [Pseudomonadota bacterium]
MAEFTEDEQSVSMAGRSDNVVPLNPAKNGRTSEIVSFDRRELDQILRLYGYKVAAGEWRDYAIDMLKDRAVFSVFRRTSEVPLFAIEKNPRLARRQGAYCVVNATGQVLKRGHELANVLRILEKTPKLASV